MIASETPAAFASSFVVVPLKPSLGKQVDRRLQDLLAPNVRRHPARVVAIEDMVDQLSCPRG
jgi:hypothetical protein